MERVVFFSAGEASGDAYAAALGRRLAGLVEGVHVRGVGGRKLGEVGVLDATSSDWGSIGIVESLRVAPRVWGGYRRAVEVLREAGGAGRAGVFVPIDYGYMNVKLARVAKAAGWRVVYFVPPGSWRREKQGGDLPGVTDAIVTPFSWSAEILGGMGARAYWFGHPLRQMVAEAGVSNGAGLGERSGVAVLPGSRGHEIAHNLPVVARAVEGFGPVRVSVAANADEEDLKEKWQGVGGGAAEFSRDTYGILKSSRAAVVCSGTATLESALCGTPTVVVYRGSKWMELEYWVRRPRIDFVSLPNILLGRGLLPELLQWAATVEGVRGALAGVWEGAGRDAQLAGFEELEGMLGGDDALDKSAELIAGFFR